MLDFDNTLIVPCLSEVNSRKDVILENTVIDEKKGIRGVPVCLANLDKLGTVENAVVASRHGLFTCLHKYVTPSELHILLDKRYKGKNECVKYIIPSLGIAERDKLRSNLSLYRNFNCICLDVANGYIQTFRDFVKEVRQLLPECFLIAGNVATEDGAEALSKAGCDMVKVGIGPGGLCETRNVTGVGYPQLQAVQDCSKVCRVMADGGLRNSGDFSKAFVAGADMVMAGSFFLSNCLAYGMASRRAAMQHAVEIQNRVKESISEGDAYRTWEGKEKVFEDKGSLDDIILQLLGGIRSSCTYCNATGIEGLKKNGRLIKVK